MSGSGTSGTGSSTDSSGSGSARNGSISTHDYLLMRRLARNTQSPETNGYKTAGRHFPRAVIWTIAAIFIAKVVVQFLDRYNALSGNTVQEIPTVIRQLADHRGLVAMAFFHSIAAVLALSFSALFQALSVVFMIWGRWETIRTHMLQLVIDSGRQSLMNEI